MDNFIASKRSNILLVFSLFGLGHGVPALVLSKMRIASVTIHSLHYTLVGVLAPYGFYLHGTLWPSMISGRITNTSHCWSIKITESVSIIHVS